MTVNNLFDKLLDFTEPAYSFFPVLTKICLLPLLFSIYFTLIVSCCAALLHVSHFFSFTMSTDANVAVPFGSKNLGDLSNNNYEVNELLFCHSQSCRECWSSLVYREEAWRKSLFDFLSCISIF